MFGLVLLSVDRYEKKKETHPFESAESTMTFMARSSTLVMGGSRHRSCVFALSVLGVDLAAALCGFLQLGHDEAVVVLVAASQSFEKVHQALKLSFCLSMIATSCFAAAYRARTKGKRERERAIHERDIERERKREFITGNNLRTRGDDGREQSVTTSSRLGNRVSTRTLFG